METPTQPASTTTFRGFYAILDTGYIGDAQWEYTAQALLAGGARLLQIRAKGHPLESTRELVERILPVAHDFDVPLIVNDHLALAVEIPGVGLHLGQEDGSIRDARQALGPNRILGLSTHSLEQAREAIAMRDLLSYFAVGPVFATATKPDYRPVGLRLVRDVRALQPTLPFFCIGGINRQNASDVLEAGATGIVSVSDPLEAPDTEFAAREITRLINTYPAA